LLAKQSQALDVELDGLSDELFGFLPRLTGGNTNRKVRDLRAHAGVSLLEHNEIGRHGSV
jgi:hypothetical protein